VLPIWKKKLETGGGRHGTYGGLDLTVCLSYSTTSLLYLLFLGREVTLLVALFGAAMSG
jgi:hypothetical protein